MKWDHPSITLSGTQRTLNRFAWLPVRLSNGVTVWLERYRVNQAYTDYVNSGIGTIRVYPTTWRTTSTYQ